MQDFRGIFGGDRRMRPSPNQSLKCPRCNSLNTKFCYYNNYNLSQPRHYCKNCRRYWTKGGVLRNVPVGGGCRKTKRSKPQSNNTESHKEKKSTTTTSNSNSESSSLTATTNETAGLVNFPDSIVFVPQNTNPETDFEASMSEGGIFPETGSFTSLMTASNPGFLGFNFNDILQEQKITSSMGEEELTTGLINHTMPVGLVEMQGRRDGGNRDGGGGLTGLEWASDGGDQGLYELGGGSEYQSYWGQNQWADNDHPLYLPPLN